jgi:hypothetical protein
MDTKDWLGVKVYGNSHSHRGFSPVDKATSDTKATVSTVFSASEKIVASCRANNCREEKTVKTVADVDPWASAPG